MPVAAQVLISALRADSSSPGLRGPHNSLEYGGRGGAEWVGRGEAGLVGNPRDELLGPGVVKASGVDAHRDDRSGLDQRGNLLVETGGAGGGRAGDAGEDLFIRIGGAEYEAVGAGAVQKPERNSRVSRMAQRALTFDQDQIWFPSRRPEDELLGGAGDEVRDHGVNTHS